MNSSINESIHSLGQDSFKWWFGVVKQIAPNDSLQSQLGQVRVRIVGYHTTDEKILPDDKLPWASVLQPTTNAAVNNKGQSANGLGPGSFVVGFFIDGDDSQQPIVIGSLYSKLINENLLENGNNVIQIGQENVIAEKSISPNSAQNPDVLRARGEPASSSNPGGIQSNITANGITGPQNTFIPEISRYIRQLLSIFIYVTTYDYEAKLNNDIDSTQSYIAITSNNFPPQGAIQIDDEQMMYASKDNYRLLDVVRGLYDTQSLDHKKGTTVKHLDGEFNAGKLVSTITGKVIDIRKEINRVISIIRNLVSWLINTIKSYLLGLIGELLQSIVSSIKSAIPFNIQIIAQAILRIMNQIGCTFDISLLDSIMNNIQTAIENAINSILKNITDFIDKVNSCINDVFDNIMSITSLISGVVRLIEGVSKIFKGISTGDIIENGKLNITKINSISNIVVILLKILGVGCGDKIKNEFDFEWSNYNCYAPSKIICGDFRITKILKGLWNPIYPFNTVIRYGEQIVSEFDNTPGHRRVLQVFPSGSFVEYIDNGSENSAVNGNRTTTIIDNDQLKIHGDCRINVDGNYHLKVSRDYHLEVNGNMYVHVGNESKIIYVGNHETQYKLNAELTSPQTIGLAATHISIGSSVTDIHAQVLSTFNNEYNNVSLSSSNNIALFENSIIGLNSNTIFGGSRNTLIANDNVTLTGNNTLNTSGLFNTTTVGAANTSFIAGNNTNYVLGFNRDITSGSRTIVTDGSNIEITGGIDSTTIAGIDIRTSEGMSTNKTPALSFNSAGLTVISS